MKKILFVMAGMVCAMLCRISVKADVIWEPEDSFYHRHAEECTYVNRVYIANGPDGEVILYKSPEMPITVTTWENGYRVGILYIYEDADGVSWGICDDYQGTVGWMPMEYMEPEYDSISFQEENADKIVRENGALDDKYIGETVLFWKYPGSEVYTEMTADSYTPEYQSLYVDGNGKKWGCVGYYFGHRNVWICLDDPTADLEKLFPEGVPAIDISPASDAGRKDGVRGAQSGGRKRIVPKINQGTVALAVILVVLVVAATGGLLAASKRKADRQKLEK